MPGNKILHIRLTPAEWHLLECLQPEYVGQYISEKARHVLMRQAATDAKFNGLVEDMGNRVKVSEKVFKKAKPNLWG